PLAVVLVCLLAAYLSLFPMLAGALAGAMRRLPRTAWALVFVPASWLLSELLRGWFMTGFPWLSLGYVLVDTPLTDLAPLGGVYFLGACVMAAAGALLLLLAGSVTGRLVSVMRIALTPVFLSWVPPAIDWTAPSGEPLRTAIIQGNFPQAVKWDRNWFQPTLDRYRRLTRQVDADLVVWPEVAVPTVARNVPDYLQAVSAAAHAKDQTVLVGVMTQHGDSDAYYNSVLALGAGSGRFDKRHLVPFGEYFPLPDFAKRWLDQLDMPYSNLGRGADHQEPIRTDDTELGLSICFEDAFGREVRRALPAADVLVNVTNDAWFIGTVAAAQHLEISRLRALEAGRPLLRAANTGISAVIGPTGRVLKRSNQLEIAILEATVQPRSGVTPYVRFGNTPVWFAALLLTALGLAWGRRRRNIDP